MLVRRSGWVVVGLLGLAVGVVQADHKHDGGCIVRVGGELQHQAQELAVELRDAYASNPHYWALRSSVREISSTAQHLQLLARHGGEAAGMKRDMENLSRVFRLLSHTVRAADASHGWVHPASWQRGGSVPPRNDCVLWLLHDMDKSICELKEEFALTE